MSTHSAATGTPNKRRHSEISSMLSSSSNHRGRGRAAAATTNHGHHPFEGFMSAFGFHRSRDAEEKRQGHSASSSSSGAKKPAPSSSTSRNSKSRPKDERHVHQVPSSSGKPSETDKRKPDPSSPRAWRTAFCSKSNKPYYWNVVTRESRWKKPIELASSSERQELEQKEKAQADFFREMEKNILARLEDGSPTVEEGAAADVDDEVLPPTGMLCGIDSSWMTSGSETTTPGAGNNDWIAGWVTPTSESSSTPGSLSNETPDSALMEGYSLASGPSPADSSLMSLGTLSREERDDRLGPLGRPGAGAAGKLERIRSSGLAIDKPALIRTISKMEFDLAHLRNLNPDLDPGLRLRAVAAPRGGTPLGERKGRRVAGDAEDIGVPMTPGTATADILSSLRLSQDNEGAVDVHLVGALPSLIEGPASPLTPVSLEGAFESPERRTRSSPIDTMPDSALADGIARPPLVTKRNTCGTIYVGSTLSAPDKDALIRCVCGVYRAHLLQSASKQASLPSQHPKKKEHAVFDDVRPPGDYRRLDTTAVPSLDEVSEFYRSVFLRSQMEADCIIISLIYVERLVKLSGGELSPCPSNWRSVLYSCMVLSSKVWDDLSMWNCDFSKINPGGMAFALKRTNELEVALLESLRYRIKVGAGEYAKYYFLLRGMLCRSGLASDDLTSLDPLDPEAAGNLSSAFDAERTRVLNVGRCKSYGDAGADCAGGEDESARVGGGGGRTGADVGGGGPCPPAYGSPSKKRVSLEQLVRMEQLACPK